MKTFFSELWNDPAKFRGAMRGVMILAAGGVATGVIPLPKELGGWIGTAIPWLLGGGAAAIPAGQSNDKGDSK